MAAGRASLEGFSVDNKVSEWGDREEAMSSEQHTLTGPGQVKSYSRTRVSGTLLSLVSTLCQSPLPWNKSTGQQDDSPGKGA